MYKKHNQNNKQIENELYEDWLGFRKICVHEGNSEIEVITEMRQGGIWFFEKGILKCVFKGLVGLGKIFDVT